MSEYLFWMDICNILEKREWKCICTDYIARWYPAKAYRLGYLQPWQAIKQMNKKADIFVD